MKTKESYYDVLGIARDADTKEVRAAYRRQSKILHPDVCTIPDGEERFQLVKLAYETLMDEKKRGLYDRQLDRGEKPWQDDTFRQFDRGFGDFYTKANTGRPPVHGLNFKHTMPFSVADVLARREATLRMNVNDRCTTCHASGRVPKQGTSTCAACDGKGFRFETVRDPITGSYTTSRRCAACDGTGHTLEETCPDCEGARLVERTIEFTFKVPETVADGKVVRMRGIGGVGLFGGEPGDVLVTLRRDRNDEAIVADNGDVYYHVLLPRDAFYEGEVKFERFDGKVETALLEPRAGCRHTIVGAGLGSTDGRRGDVHYLFYPDLATRGR